MSMKSNVLIHYFLLSNIIKTIAFRRTEMKDKSIMTFLALLKIFVNNRCMRTKHQIHRMNVFLYY